MQAPQTLAKILTENTNHPQTKQTLKLICETREKITYHAMISSNQTYLQVRGLANHNYDQFNYIHKMLHSRIVSVTSKIKRKQMNVKNTHDKFKHHESEEENQANEEIMAQVQYVMNNIDLPISLFKRNDKYWYPENPKTLEAKKYVHDRIKQDRQRKRNFKTLQLKKKQEHQKSQMQVMERNRQLEETQKEEMRQNIQRNIEMRKKQKQDRQKKIKQSQQFGSSLKPLFKQIQQEENKHHHSALEEQKKRLSQLRRLHQSVDMVEIQERTKKLEEMKKNKEQVKIFNDPVKVYKSKYYTSMTSRSRVGEYDSSKSLYDKKKEYGNLVRKQYRPDVDPELVQEIQERLKLMKRKRVRKNPKVPPKSDDDNDDESDNSEHQQSKVKQETKKVDIDLEDYDSDEDDDNRPPKRIRGEDEDPNHAQRYEMGVQYLEHMRNLPKKQQKTIAKFPQEIQQEQRKARYTKGNTGHKHFYKDYLRQFTSNRNTIDHIDVSRIKNKYNKSIVGRDYATKSELANEARSIEEKAKNQEQLLKYKKMKNQEAIEKRVEIDNAVIETIKARLAMMG